jgi:Tol biopolymer transport system component
VWTRELARGIDSRLTTSGGNTPVWSADGTTIYFSFNRDGAPRTYQINANQTGTGDVVEGAAGMIPREASRDGHYLLTITPETNPTTGTDIWVLPLIGDRKPFPYLKTEFAEGAPSLSPDGLWLAYQSDESRSAQVYVDRFLRKGQKTPVSTTGGLLPVWSRDVRRRELYYYSLDGQIMAVDVMPSVSGSAQSPFGVPRKLFAARIAQGSGFAVSKDGHFLLPVLLGQQDLSAPMTVVLNWPELLKKK